MLVDDEDIIRQGLLKYITNNHSDIFETVALENGKEAIGYLNNNIIDIVITDINMPYVDGIALSEFIYNNFPMIKVVILSGYKDFEYAQKSLEYNVSRYLLKPIDKNELSVILKKLTQELNEEELIKLPTFLQDELFISIIYKSIDISELSAKLREVNLSPNIALLPGFIYKLNITQSERWLYGRDRNIIALLNYIRLSHFYAYTLFIQGNYLLLLLIPSSPQYGSNEFEVALEKASTELNCHISNQCCHEFANISEIWGMYKKFEDIMSEDKISHNQTLLNYYVNSGNKDKAVQMLLELIDLSVAEQEKSQHNSIIVKAKQYVETHYSYDISLAHIADHVFMNPSYFSRFFKQQTGETFSDYLLAVRMNKTIELLKQHLPTFTIYSKVGYNDPNYFNRLFKSYTGYSLKAYCREVINRTE